MVLAGLIWGILETVAATRCQAFYSLNYPNNYDFEFSKNYPGKYALKAW